jgi:simple sugar transport system permease protein
MSTAAPSAAGPDAGLRWHQREWFTTHVQTVSIGLVLVVVIVFFSNFATSFLTSGNLLNLLRQLAPLLILAVAMTFVITTSGIDLSVGSVVGLTASLGADLLSRGVSPVVMIVAMLALGASVGLLNGYFTAYERLPAFIVTLATLTLVRGIALAITQGESIPIDPDLWFVNLGQGRVAGIPVPVLIAVPVTLVGWLVLTRTRFGGYVTGIGSNEEAVRRAGVDTRRILLATYVLAGFAAAVAGLLFAARLGSGSSNAGSGLELQVIAAVVLGGTSLFGGQGTIVGTVLGALTIGVIGNGLILMQVSTFYVQIVQGLVLLLAIYANKRLFSRFTKGVRT